MNVNKLDNTWKLQIKQWIKDSKNARIGLWGEIPHSSVCTISHSIYALRTLECIDGNVREKYPDEINRLYKLILKNSYPFEYEEYSFPKKKKDSDGKNYDRVRINHFILPLAIDFFITIGDMAKARFLVKVLINNHHNGRWGLYDTLHTVWATQQAVDAITYFDSKEKDFIYYIECAKLWCYRNLTSIIVGILIVSLLVIILLRDGVGTTIISVLVGTCTGVAANMLTDWYRTGIGNHRAF